VGDIRIGWVKKAAGKGDRIRVYFPDGTSKEAIAQTDIINDKVGFVGGYAFSGNEARIISVDRPKLFKSKSSYYEEDLIYPFLSVYLDATGNLIAIYDGTRRVIGKVEPLMPAISDIVLRHQGNTKLKGLLLSLDKTICAAFTDNQINITTGLNAVDNEIAIRGNLIVSRKKTIPGIDLYFDQKGKEKFFPTFPALSPQSSGDPMNFHENSYRLSGYTDSSGFALPSLTVDTLYYRSFSGNQTRNNIESSGSGYSTVTYEISEIWAAGQSGGIILPPISYPSPPPYVSGDIGKRYTLAITHNWFFEDTNDAFVLPDDSETRNYYRKLEGSQSKLISDINDINLGVQGYGVLNPLSQQLALHHAYTVNADWVNTTEENYDVTDIIKLPVVVCDRKTVVSEIIKSEIYSLSGELELVFLTSSTDILSANKVCSNSDNLSQQESSTIYTSVVNTGEFGLYREDLSQEQIIQTNTDYSEQPELMYPNVSIFAPDPPPGYGLYDRITRHDQYVNNLPATVDNQELIGTQTKVLSSLFKAAFYNSELNQLIEKDLTPGIASFCTLNAAHIDTINSFLAGDPQSSTITFAPLSPLSNQSILTVEIDYVSREYTHNIDGSTQVHTFERSPYPPNNIGAVDIEGAELVLMVNRSNSYFLIECTVSSTVNFINSDPFVNSRKTITQITATINKAARIKPFNSPISQALPSSFLLNNQSFFFTKKGCDVFEKMFEEHNINYIVKKEDNSYHYYLAVTLTPIFETGSQALLFEIIPGAGDSYDISFVKLLTGAVTNSQEALDFAPRLAQWCDHDQLR
jgi:hypothetical protein